MMTTRDALHQFVHELSDDEAERLLGALQSADSVARGLARAPIDDEPETPEEAAAVAEARAAVGRGELLSTGELRRRLGL